MQCPYMAQPSARFSSSDPSPRRSDDATRPLKIHRRVRLPGPRVCKSPCCLRVQHLWLSKWLWRWLWRWLCKTQDRDVEHASHVAVQWHCSVAGFACSAHGAVPALRLLLVQLVERDLGGRQVWKHAGDTRWDLRHRSRHMFRGVRLNGIRRCRVHDRLAGIAVVFCTLTGPTRSGGWQIVVERSH
jgi:hypothetical protein